MWKLQNSNTMEKFECKEELASEALQNVVGGNSLSKISVTFSMTARTVGSNISAGDDHDSDADSQM